VVRPLDAQQQARMNWNAAPNDPAWWKEMKASLLPVTPRAKPG
jgi:hypothetical protein